MIDTSIGYFSTVSDFGSYAYIWTHPGGEFRQFLIRLNTDYLVSKLMYGRPDADVTDWHETKASLLEFLEEEPDWQYYEEEKERLEESSFHSELEFYDAMRDSHIEEYWRHIVSKPNPQAVAFCNRVMPRLKAILQAELDDEAKTKTKETPETD